MITIENSIRSFYIILILSILVISNTLNNVKEDVSKVETLENLKSSDPTPILTYRLIEKYSNEYLIPKHIAYNIAYKETRYKGPFHWSYKPDLESFAGAVGPMQVMLSTANRINDEAVDRKKLRSDLSLNIETSMKLLRRLYNKHGDWAVVCGAYNTGQPIINDYARFCVGNKDYKKNWIYYQK